MLTLTIDRRREIPVYEQVADQVRRLVASGDLEPGTALPSVRQLAGDLGVNLNTVARAYRQLEDEGFVRITGRSRAEVIAPSGAARPGERRRLREELRHLLARMRQAGLSIEQLEEVALREIRELGGQGRER